VSSYRIWFKVNGYDEIELPVNPSEVTITYPGNVTNYDVEGLGEIAIPRLPKLATVTFESFFPREGLYNSMINSESWYSPEWYVNFFRKIQKGRMPFELTIVRGFDNIQTFKEDNNSLASQIERTEYFDTVFSKAILLDFSITDKGGEPGDVYYSMGISEYRDASPQTMAELAGEEIGDDGEVLSQKMVLVKNRPPQSGVIAVNRSVEISGEVYDTIEQAKEGWEKIRKKANKIDRVVSRVLPPGVSQRLHSIYVSGLGWVDKGSCKLAESVDTVIGIKTLVDNNYD